MDIHAWAYHIYICQLSSSGSSTGTRSCTSGGTISGTSGAISGTSSGTSGGSSSGTSSGHSMNKLDISCSETLNYSITKCTNQLLLLVVKCIHGNANIPCLYSSAVQTDKNWKLIGCVKKYKLK